MSSGPHPQDESGEVDARLRRREQYREQMRASIGGWTGMAITAVPPVVFVIANVVGSLRAAIVAAVGSAVLLAAYRLARRQPVQQAVSGLFAVVIAALIAARTGEARGYFLLGIWASFAYAVPFAVSLLVRRPLVGLIWEYLDPSTDPSPEHAGAPWYKRTVLLRAYSVITLVALVVFLARGVVQLTLYGQNATGWLAFAKVAMGYPLYLVAVVFGIWYGGRARRLVAADAGSSADAGPSADHGAAEGGLGFG